MRIMSCNKIADSASRLVKESTDFIKDKRGEYYPALIFIPALVKVGNALFEVVASAKLK